MGSVIDYIECPRCKQENCVDDFYYKSGEEYITCFDCGYYESFSYKKDKKGNYLMKDKTKGYEFDNLIPEEVKITNPYGAYKIEFIDSCGNCGILKTENDYNEFVSNFESLGDQEDNIKQVVVSRLVGEVIEKEIIFELNKED